MHEARQVDAAITEFAACTAIAPRTCSRSGMPDRLQAQRLLAAQRSPAALISAQVGGVSTTTAVDSTTRGRPDEFDGTASLCPDVGDRCCGGRRIWI